MNLFPNIFCFRYFKYVEEVLTSVYKTEESLRRLKQIREMSAQQNDSAGITDGDKIRLQLNIDILFYGKIIEMLKINVNSVQKYTELFSMVTEAIKCTELSSMVTEAIKCIDIK